MIKRGLYLLCALTLLACHRQKTGGKAVMEVAFDADSAYRFVREQVDFGPRVPGSRAHEECASYLRGQLARFGARTEVQQGQMTDYKGAQQAVVNIIGHYGPDKAANRVLLCAHWDSRPWADQEENYEARTAAIPGANDGASGVGVLLEIARQLQYMEPQPAVDIVLFDCEDMGTPTFHTGKEREDTWCLGSQLWARQNQRAYTYGILLDMVGAPDAIFPREYHSMVFARQYTDKVWNIAQRLGYTQFIDQACYPITDDHYYINTIAGIPCIDIIHYNPQTANGFGHYWHTLEDDMRNISPATLEAVGKVTMGTITH